MSRSSVSKSTFETSLIKCTSKSPSISVASSSLNSKGFTSPCAKEVFLVAFCLLDWFKANLSTFTRLKALTDKFIPELLFFDLKPMLSKFATHCSSDIEAIEKEWALEDIPISQRGVIGGEYGPSIGVIVLDPASLSKLREA